MKSNTDKIKNTSYVTINSSRDDLMLSSDHKALRRTKKAIKCIFRGLRQDLTLSRVSNT